MKTASAKSFGSVIVQILLIDLIFSVDSILTAVGMTNGIAKETGGNPLVIIYAAVNMSCF